ncbi:MAG: aminopeptidase P family protein [Acidobacteria bacterium]|nr:aminopeptidase P family protein [Acidobacteriota bacterium]
MVERRDVLKGLAAGAISAALSPTLQGSIAQAAQVDVVKTESFPSVDGKPLINQARAYEVLEQENLDGMIALNPVNVYYLTNTWSIGAKMRREVPGLATFPRDPKQPTFYVTSRSQLLDIANRRSEVPELMPYTGLANWREYIGADQEQMKIEPEASQRTYPVNKDAPLSTREQGWVDIQEQYRPTAAATPEWALARALKESGLSKGRLAVDDMRLRDMLERIGMADGITFVPGDNVFRKIRYIKSPVEIELMRIAGQKNAAAALATMRSIQAGMTYEDIERRFMTEAASHGNQISFILAGVTLGLLPHGEVKRGQAILVDAVSHFRQYHGDFARTVVVGDPPKDVAMRAKANQIGREAAFEIVKPGVKYSQIRAVAFEAMKKSGMPEEAIIVNPHSVGLQHTDQPYRDDVPYPIAPDIELKPGMTITIDLPYIEVGWGAGHNEDLILITQTGYQALHTEEDPLVVT